MGGNAPIVIAKGGFSGLFSESCSSFYSFVIIASSPETILWRDLKMTKDSIGVYIPDMNLDRCTNIAHFYSERKTTYTVNGFSVTGWFTTDLTLRGLAQVSLKQGIYS